MSALAKTEPCPKCGRFDNRGVSIDAVILRGSEVLLVQRGVEPQKGYWGTPGGYVEWDESAEDAAVREVKEETGLDVTDVRLVAVHSSPSRHPRQVINIVFAATVSDGEPTSGDDALAVRWFPVDALPAQMALDHRQNITEALAARTGA